MSPAWLIGGLAGWLAVSAVAAPLLGRWIAEQLPIDLTAPPMPTDDEIAARVEELLEEIRRETA